MIVPKKHVRNLLGLPQGENEDVQKRSVSSVTTGTIHLISNSGRSLSQPGRQEQGLEADWSKLIEGIQIVSKHSKEIGYQADIQREQVERILEETRRGIEGYENRICAAEKAAEDAKETARVQIMAAEERTRLAEERALAAESWLKRVQDAMFTEFNDLLTWSAAS
ncbi:hypothetical protein [Methylorubrum podarium]|jgi:hypothetical protein|uniref:hypothetical protein n=1 Tax=Methylorubrum podarium TaxID=200476 RepID=UPI001EE2D0E7|nr:hypothetical protein [Methylorubrum podarium]